MMERPPAKQLHESLNLYVSSQFYSFEPLDHVSASLTINRTTGHVTIEQPTASRSSPVKRANKVFGILGLLSLTTSDFVVVVTGRELHGRIFGHEIYRATDFKVLPLDSSPSHQHPVEIHLLALIRSHLNEGTFWFSYTWDMTKRLQMQSMTREQDVKKALWETADDRFFWNKFLHSRFIDITNSSPDQDLSRYILPVMYGTFKFCNASINSRPFRFGLISRRSRYRAGTRYFTRGVDEEGHVANFNETEQIVILDDSIANNKYANTVLSFVQTRGSVPVFWAEVNNLRYTPDLQIMDLQDTALAFRLHFQEQISTYGSQHVVNLVKQHGREKFVKEAYERYLAEAGLPKVQYDYFDFHKECKNMQFHRIETLVDRIKDDLVEKGYFHEHGSTTPQKLQSGTIRTNCMDNLDRTNVVQSALGEWTLTQQLRAVGILQENERIGDSEEFMDKFRNVWADHADAISKAYSGSGALKTDVTRTGKRTRKGMVQDGVNSILRYLKNNYFDGARQDAFDVFTGAWVPRKGPGLSRSLLFDSRPFTVRSMPYVLSFSIFMVFAGLTLPGSSDYSLVYYFFIWICLALISLGYIFAHGIEYVSWPRLHPPVDAIHYNGPGHRTGQRGKGLWGLAPRSTIKRTIGRPRGDSKLEEVEIGSVKKRLD